MSRLEIFVRKNNKRTNFAVAIGLIKSNNSFFKEIVIKDDAKNAVFSLVNKFKEMLINVERSIPIINVKSDVEYFKQDNNYLKENKRR